MWHLTWEYGIEYMKLSSSVWILWSQVLICSRVLIHFVFLVSYLQEVRCSGRKSNSFRHKELPSVPPPSQSWCWCLVNDPTCLSWRSCPSLSPVAEWICHSWGSSSSPFVKDGQHDPALDITMPHYSGNNSWAKDISMDPAEPIRGYY